MSSDLYQRLSRLSALTPVRRREPVPHQDAHERDDLLTSLGAKVRTNRYGEHLTVRQWYATPAMWEPSTDVLRLLLPPRSDSIERMIRHAADPTEWLFLDTETTGLVGGTGTYAFLVGLAWWESGGIQIEQLFMRDHDEEHSVLLEIAHRLDERPVLFTFNGKCFDWPLLENRFRMTRQIDVPALAVHLDLLHPARQLWRLQIGSTRLADLERHILGPESLGWSRDEDVDSSRIPEFYFDFLRGGGVEGMAGVFQHNQMDLRGLASLAGRIFRTLTDPGAGTDHQQPLELYAVSRLLNRRGECSKARRACERSLNAGLPEPIARKAMHEVAKLAKKDRDFGRALELWRELASSTEPSLEALEQLAIYYEHRERNSAEAARVTRLALAELRRARRLGLMGPERHEQLSARLQQRLFRLASKANQVAVWKPL